MAASFVAVLAGSVLLAAGADDVRAALRAAGARHVLGWPDLAEDTDLDGYADMDGDADLQDDAAAVLFDHADEAELAAFTQLSRALAGIAAANAAIVSTRPVTDTLKLVDAEGRLRATAERDHHRMPTTPIVTSLGLLRAVQDCGPDPLAVIAALAGRGVTILDAAAPAGSTTATSSRTLPESSPARAVLTGSAPAGG